MSTIRATYVQHGSSAVPNITLNASGQVIVASGIVSSGTFAAPTGSAAAPGVYFVGDTNTGLYSPGADQVAVATNGDERMRIDSSGNLGLGTASPTDTGGYGRALDIQSNTGAAIYLRTNDDTSQIAQGSSDLTIRTRQAHPIIFNTNNGERLRITSAGLVGIGTSSPTDVLHVVGDGGEFDNSATSLATSASNAKIRFQNRSGSSLSEFQGTVNGGGTWYSQIANGAGTGAYAQVFNPFGGNVGIGVTGPSEKLDVNGAVRVTNESAGWGSGAEGGFIDYYSPASLVRFGHLNGASGSAKNVVCYTGGSEAFRVDSNRRLLVGTSSNYTNYRLQIEGTEGAGSGMSIRRSQSGNASPPILVFAKNRSGTLGGNAIVQSGDYLGSILFRGNDGSSDINAAHIESFVDGTPGANDMPGRLTFSTTADGASSPTERLRITSAGNVGIGTTSPSRRLTVNSTTTGNINYVRLQETTTNTPTNGGSFIELGGTRSNGTYGFYGGILGGRRFQGGDNTGYLAFYTDNNDGESLAERVRIDHLGRLLVGTSTAPTNVYPTTAATTPSTVFDSDSNQLSFMLNNNSPSGNIVAFARRYTAAANGTIARLIFPQYDGTNYRTAAQIAAEIDGTPGTADMPGRLVFSTTADGASSPTERMRLDNKGAVSTFATNDTAFAVKNSATAGTTISNIAGFYSATGTGNGTASFRVYTNGNVVNTNNSYGAISDIKLKENIVDANSQWDDLKALQVRNYNFKEGQTHTQIGLVAQEAELVSPGLVYESPDRDEDGNDLGTVTKSVNYSVLYMKAVKALQEAMERIEVLEQRLNDAGIN
jgi:hypothetical protein